MKRLYTILCLPLAALFFACSTDIDLYAKYEEKPIIYGLLDPNADTNFIKISRTFYVRGDAYQVAANPDSSNYPGKLDVRMIEYCNGDSIREIVFDTSPSTTRSKAYSIRPTKSCITRQRNWA